MALTREQIEKLNGLEDSEKSDLLALFQTATDNEAEVKRLRKSQPADSQVVVDKQKYKELEAAIKKSDSTKSELEDKIRILEMRTPEGEDISADDALVMFAPVIELLCGPIGAITKKENDK